MTHWITADEIPDFVPPGVIATVLICDVGGNITAARNLLTDAKMKLVWNEISKACEARDIPTMLSSINEIIDDDRGFFSHWGISLPDNPNDKEKNKRAEIYAGFFYLVMKIVSSGRHTISSKKVDDWISDYRLAATLCKRKLNDTPLPPNPEQRAALDIAGDYFERCARIIQSANEHNPYKQSQPDENDVRGYVVELAQLNHKIFGSQLSGTIARIVNVAALTQSEITADYVKKTCR